MKKIKIKVKKPLVFVPMSADILHKGHINILKRAKKFGSVIVGLMTDKGIVSYKKKKPLFKYKDRKSLLMSLRYVDQVIPIEGLKYAEYQAHFKFQFFVHGDDWKSGAQKKSREKLVMIAKKTNGNVIDATYTKGVSSTSIKKKILR
jgi:glycerol-3-phosphate cytidylyltransferase